MDITGIKKLTAKETLLVINACVAAIASGKRIKVTVRSSELYSSVLCNLDTISFTNRDEGDCPIELLSEMAKGNHI